MAAPTFFGVATNPADAGSLAEPQTAAALTPPASMVAGDLVVVFIYNENGSANDGMAINGTGGQSWTSDVTEGSYSFSGAAAGHRIYWCRFNGTWTADPTFNFPAKTGTRGCGMQMLVFRPDSGTKTWSLNIGPNWATYSAPTTPFTVTITGVTPTKPDTVTIARWVSDDDNTWNTLTGTGWLKTGLAAQYANSGGSDLSTTYAYNLKGAASATNNTSQNQVTLGGDAGSTVILTFYAAAVAINMTASPGGYDLTGSDAGLLYFRKVTADAGSYALTGSDVSFIRAKSVIADPGAYSLTGSNVSLFANRVVQSDAGAYSLTGSDASFILAKKVVADAGSYALTGSDASLVRTLVLVSDSGAYSFSGETVNLVRALTLTADAGAYSLTGSDVTLTVTGGGAITLTADAGSFTLTGEDAGLYAARVVTADPGAFNYTGSDVTLTYTQVASLSLTADPGAFQLTGSDATLTYVPLEDEEKPRLGAQLGRIKPHGVRGRRGRRARYWWEEEEQETEIRPEVISLSPPIVKQEVNVPRVRFHAEPEKPQVNLAPMMRAMRKRAKMKLAAMIALDMLDE